MLIRTVVSVGLADLIVRILDVRLLIFGAQDRTFFGLHPTDRFWLISSERGIHETTVVLITGIVIRIFGPA